MTLLIDEWGDRGLEILDLDTWVLQLLQNMEVRNVGTLLQMNPADLQSLLCSHLQADLPLRIKVTRQLPDADGTLELANGIMLRIDDGLEQHNLRIGQHRRSETNPHVH